MPSCDQKLYGDPRNTCVTTGSFPACAVMWVSYNCDLLGYSQYLEICGANHWFIPIITEGVRQKTALNHCAQEEVCTNNVCVSCCPGHFV